MEANRWIRSLWLAGAVGMIALTPQTGTAQTGCIWNGCLGDTPFSSDYTRVGLSNGSIYFIMGALGTSTWGNDGDNTTGDPPNKPEEGCFDPSFSVNAPGRWTFGTDGGSQVSSLDNTCAITFGWPHPGGNFCYGTIRIVDNGTTTDHVFGESDGTWNIRPYVGLSNAYVTGQWTVQNVWIVLRVDILGDTWRFRWDFYNLNDHAVQVGLRVSQWLALKQVNPQFAWGDRTGFLSPLPYMLLPGKRPVQSDFDLDKSKLGVDAFPPYFDAFFNQAAPYPSFRHWLKRDAQHPDMTTVDRLVFGTHIRVSDGLLWDPLLLPDAPVGRPAYAVFNNPVNVPIGTVADFDVEEAKARPGLRIIQYASLANSVTDAAMPIPITTETNRVLNYAPGGAGDLDPNPFKIYAAVTDGYSVLNQEVDLTNVTLALSLPPGLKLSTGETAQKTIGSIPAGQTGAVSWNVEATGEYSGALSYRVLVSAPPATAKSVTNTILLPPTTKFRGSDKFDMVTFPFTFTDARFSTIFGISGLRTIGIDPTTGRYIPLDSAQRGVGLWINTGDTSVYSLAGAGAPPGQTTSSFIQTLKPGWNMIGNPWLYPVELGQVVVIAASNPNKVLTLAEAVQSGLVKGVLFNYDKTLGEYQFTQDLSTVIQPARGYWIRVISAEPVQWIWPQVFQVGVGGTPRGPVVDPWSPRPGHFRLQLSAHGKNTTDSQTFFGITGDGQPGVDKYDVPKPPMAPDGKLSVSIQHGDWGNQSGAYAQDIRSAAATNQTWEFTVDAAEEGDVTLTWPNLSQLPSDKGFRLTDLQSGVVRMLRNVSAYTFHTTEGQRRFKLEMVAASASKVVITGVNLNQTRGGVTIQYALSGDATTTVRVMSASGKVVQVLAQNTAETRGVQTHAWNGRDTAGVAMPPGTYLVEVAATTTDGQIARVVRPHVLTR